MQLSYTHILVLFVYYHSFINILNYELVFFIILLKFIFILVFINSYHFLFKLSCKGTISNLFKSNFWSNVYMLCHQSAIVLTG